jgi:hypothetical protein
MRKQSLICKQENVRVDEPGNASLLSITKVANVMSDACAAWYAGTSYVCQCWGTNPFV